MKNEDSLSPEERDLEAVLARLQPAKTAIDRDRLMFLAGRRSVRRYGWMWPSIAALLAVALTVSLATRPGTKPAEPFGYVLQDSPTPTDPFTPSGPSMGPSKFSYTQMRHVILDQGIDALPVPELPPVSNNPLSCVNKTNNKHFFEKKRVQS
jgi:hypothetical protein